MLDQICAAILGLATIAAVFSVQRGDRAAIVLMASTLFSTMLIEAGVPFRLEIWLAIDLCAIMWIVIGWIEARPFGARSRLRERLIIGLFAPIWMLYFFDLAWRAAAIDLMIAAQMLLTQPHPALWAKAKGAFFQGIGRKNEGMECSWPQLINPM